MVWKKKNRGYILQIKNYTNLGQNPIKKKRLKIYIQLENNQPITHAKRPLSKKKKTNPKNTKKTKQNQKQKQKHRHNSLS